MERVVIKLGYQVTNSAQIPMFSTSVISYNGNQCPSYCLLSIARSNDKMNWICLLQLMPGIPETDFPFVFS